MANKKQHPKVRIPFPGMSIGAGDVIAKVTSAIGFKECEGCRKRREALNRALAFGTPRPDETAP